MTEKEFESAAITMPADSELAIEFIQTITSDYVRFVQAIWYNRKLQRVSPLDEVAKDMCKWAANGPRRRGVLAFRGEGKTHKVSACLTCYRLRRDPQRKVFIIGKSKGEAKKTLALVKAWLNKVWFLQDLAPVVDGQKWRRDNTEQLDVGPANEHRQPSVTAIGIEGNIEGNRAHTIIPDDIETKGNTKTADARAELLRLANEFTNVLYPETDTVDPVEIVAAGTPKNEETVYLKFIDQGFTFQSYPIIYPTADENVICLAPFLREKLERGEAKPGDPTCPLRFNHTEIADRRASGYTEFAMEFLLIADLARTNRYPLRLSDLIVFPVHRDRAPISLAWGHRDHNGSTAAAIQSLGMHTDRLYHPIMVDERWAPYEVTKAALDPAGRGADKSGLAIGAALAGMIHFKLARGLTGGVDPDTLDNIAQLLRAHNAIELYLETNNDVYGTMQAAVEQALTRHRLEPGTDPSYPDGWACSITPMHNTGQKELRIIRTLEPVFSSHRAVFDPSIFDPPAEEIKNDLQFQITRLTKERKCLDEDGILDAMEMLTRHLVGTTMARPQKVQAEEAHDKYFERLTKKFRVSLGLEPLKEPEWFGRV